MGITIDISDCEFKQCTIKDLNQIIKMIDLSGKNREDMHC